jgi:murein DD-endopeptidase MepM/ murein hydrolase activator NlpD
VTKELHLALPPARESGVSPTPDASQPLTRREARAREAALAAEVAPVEHREPIDGGEYVAVRIESEVLPPAAATSEVLRPRDEPARRPRRSVAKAAPASAPASRAKSRRVKVVFEKAPKQRGNLASKLFSLTALLGAGALLVGMSIPANAFMSVADEAPTAGPVQLPGQSLAVSGDAAAATTLRDGYEVLSKADVLKLKYSGVEYAYTATSGDVRWPFPTAVAITDGFGVPRNGWPHKGIDFVPGAGAPIYSIAAGTVVSAGYDESGYGNHVIIQHNLGGVNVQSHYAHMIMDSSALQPGDNVEVGEFIGLVGDTGIAYGAHLHFEILIDGVHVDPYAWLTANAV